MHVMVCGGTGYIGSHMAKWLAARGVTVIVLDNLSTGHREPVQWGDLIEADLPNPASLERAFAGRRFDVVIHFCARSLVDESMTRPYDYYANNVTGTLNLLQAMQRHGVDRLVFSSTAAVFGQPISDRIDEDHPTAPINPYGASKLMVERMSADAHVAYGLRSVALRFNAAGASPDGDIGEAQNPETHLIPDVLRGALGTGPALQVFGDDYPTPRRHLRARLRARGRLAQAHQLALEYMDHHAGAHTFNLGNGRGFSVREVMAAAEHVTRKPVPRAIAPRREGDPAVLVASSDKARRELGWSPRYTEMTPIIESTSRRHAKPCF